jgi:hypothetical protein
MGPENNNEKSQHQQNLEMLIILADQNSILNIRFNNDLQ